MTMLFVVWNNSATNWLAQMAGIWRGNEFGWYSKGAAFSTCVNNGNGRGAGSDEIDDEIDDTTFCKRANASGIRRYIN